MNNENSVASFERRSGSIFEGTAVSGACLHCVSSGTIFFVAFNVSRYFTGDRKGSRRSSDRCHHIQSKAGRKEREILGV